MQRLRLERLRLERLRLERQRQDEEELRAREAAEHVEIVPIETVEEMDFREQIVAARRRQGNPGTHRVACKEIVSEDNVHLHLLGEMSAICTECDAKHFLQELPKDKKFQQCCRKGSVILPSPKKCPPLLLELLLNNHPKSVAFLRSIRQYNSAHAFASMGANISPPPGRGPYVFRIYGVIYHQITTLGETNNPRYADLYFWTLPRPRILEQTFA